MRFKKLLLLPVLFTLCLQADDRELHLPQYPLTQPTKEALPRWSGFNLIEKLNGRNLPYREDDFRMIASFGFNFVRLPMDYRAWSGVEEDWERFDERALLDIDEAVQFGIKHNVHVCLNFHRAPGYHEVKKPKYALFSDDKALEACARHWALFAKRYKGISSKYLSFNLLNEPPSIPEATSENYRRVIERLVNAVRAEDPERFLIVDGERGAFRVPKALDGLNVAVAAHGYLPHRSLTHYGAGFTGVDYSGLPAPIWGTRNHFSGVLNSRGQTSQIVFKEPLKFPTSLSIEIGTVYERGDIALFVDGEQAGTWPLGNGAEQTLPWKTQKSIPGTNISSYVFNRPLFLETLPAGTQSVSFQCVRGKLNFNRLQLEWKDETKAARTAVLEARNQDPVADDETMPEWMRSAVFDQRTGAFEFPNSPDGRTFLEHHIYGSWRAFSQGTKTGILIGEFGFCNTVPRKAALDWMRDSLEVFRKNNWPWANWQFRGVWGVLDSENPQVTYEDFEGHKLDREKLKLLQSYR